jgi:hypothetical protein
MHEKETYRRQVDPYLLQLPEDREMDCLSQQALEDATSLETQSKELLACAEEYRKIVEDSKNKKSTTRETDGAFSRNSARQEAKRPQVFNDDL